MGKLRVLSGAEVCQILSDNGFVRVRQKGDHFVMQKTVGESTITLPIPLHRELATGTLAAIIRQSGIPRRFFEIP